MCIWYVLLLPYLVSSSCESCDTITSLSLTLVHTQPSAHCRICWVSFSHLADSSSLSFHFILAILLLRSAATLFFDRLSRQNIYLKFELCGLTFACLSFILTYYSRMDGAVICIHLPGLPSGLQAAFRSGYPYAGILESCLKLLLFGWT